HNFRPVALHCDQRSLLPAPLHNACDGETTEEARRQIISVVLEAQRITEQLLFRQTLARKRFIYRKPRDDRRAAASQPAGKRNLAIDQQPRAVELMPAKITDRTSDSKNQI